MSDDLLVARFPCFRLRISISSKPQTVKDEEEVNVLKTVEQKQGPSVEPTARSAVTRCWQLPPSRLLVELGKCASIYVRHQ